MSRRQRFLRTAKMLLCALAICGIGAVSAQPSPMASEPYVDAARRTLDLANLLKFGVTPLLDLAGPLFGPRIELEGQRGLGRSYLTLDSVEPARHSWARVEELTTRLNDEDGLVEALAVLGDLDLHAGDSESARLSSDRLAAFAIKRSEPGLASAALRLRGVARRREGRLDAALEDLQDSVAKAREARSDQLLGDALNALGSLYRDQGDFANALEAHLQARDARLASGFRLDTTYRNIALLYREIDDQAMVRDYLDKALALSIKQGNASGLAPILGSRATVLNDQGEFAAALDAAHQATLIDEMSGHRSSIGFNLVESGRALVGLGRIEEAMAWLQSGLAAGRESGVREIVARALLAMAAISIQRDDKDTAQSNLDDAGAVLEDARLLPQLVDFYALSEQLAASEGNLPAQLRFAKRHAEQRELMLGVRAGRQLAELKVRNSRLASDQALESLRSRNELQATRLRMQSLEQRNTWYAIVALVLLAMIGAWRYFSIRRLNTNLTAKNREIQLQQQQLHHANELLLESSRELHAISIRDALTGCYNRARLMHHLQKVVPDAIERGSDVSVLMIDLDHFKFINDRRGHLHGDAVLIAAVKAMTSELGGDDDLARYGGEECVVVLDAVNITAATAVAERLRARVQNDLFDLRAGDATGTISVGVASLSLLPQPSLDSLLDAADQALYRAKARGRNRVAREGEERMAVT